MDKAILIVLSSIIVSCSLGACSYTDDENEKAEYKVSLQLGSKIIDTTIALDFLQNKTSYDLPGAQYLQEFKYPKLNYHRDDAMIKLSNDSISISMHLAAFDSMEFRNLYEIDSIHFLQHPYFRWVPEEWEISDYLPKTEVRQLIFDFTNSDNHSKTLKMQGVFDPRDFAAYVTDNSELLLTIACGGGAGAYILLFVLNNHGDLIRRIEAPVI